MFQKHCGVRGGLLRNKYDLGHVGSQHLRGLIQLLFENKTMLIECMRFSTKIVNASEALWC